MFNVALNENYGLLNGTINNKVLDYTYGTNQNVTWLKDSITNYELEMIYGSNKIESLNYGGTPTQFDYEYDLNGNVLKDHKAQYNYDSKNNLEFSKTKIKVNGSETTVLTKYYYNGLNQRIAKEIQGGQIKYFAYNENNQIIGEYDNNGNVISEYVYFENKMKILTNLINGFLFILLLIIIYYAIDIIAVKNDYLRFWGGSAYKIYQIVNLMISWLIYFLLVYKKRKTQNGYWMLFIVLIYVLFITSLEIFLPPSIGTIIN